MFEKLDSGVTSISIEPARGRQTPDNSFAAMFERGAIAAVQVVGAGVKAVSPLLPGGGYLSAAVDAVGGLTTAGAGIEGGLGGGGELSGTGDKWQLLRAQQRMQEEGLSNSLRLLALQRQMHEENQNYTTTSNLLKARHDMAKAAINNLR
jgi:hypothetical protein